MKTFALLFSLFGLAFGQNANQIGSVGLYTNTGTQPTHDLVVPVRIRYTCDNNCYMVHIGSKNGFTFWDSAQEGTPSYNSWTTVRERLVYLPYGDHVISVIAGDRGDKAMVAMSVNVNNFDYSTPGEHWRVSTTEPSDLAWRWDPQYTTSSAGDQWRAPCVFDSSSPDEARRPHPDWLAQTEMINGLLFPGQTKPAEFVWAKCGIQNSDRVYMRFRFSILRGSNSSPRRLGRRSAEAASAGAEMEHVEL